MPKYIAAESIQVGGGLVIDRTEEAGIYVRRAQEGEDPLAGYSMFDAEQDEEVYPVPAIAFYRQDLTEFSKVYQPRIGGKATVRKALIEKILRGDKLTVLPTLPRIKRADDD